MNMKNTLNCLGCEDTVLWQNEKDLVNKVGGQHCRGANRRIAFLMINGILLSHGYSPLTILEEMRDNFERKLVLFYETGNATPLVRLRLIGP